MLDSKPNRHRQKSQQFPFKLTKGQIEASGVPEAI
jgi:hypothetical protein